MPGAALVGTITVAGLNSGTSATLDTTGATLLVVYVGYLASVPPAISDSKSNTWNGLTIQTTTVSGACQFYYASNPIVGSGHTFSFTGTGSATGLIAAAFSGIITVSPFDAEGPGFVGGPSANGINPGPLSSTVPNELFVVGGSWENNGVPVTDNNASFTITDSVDVVGGSNYGVAFGYKIATGSQAPNLVNSASGRRVGVLASFIPDGNTPESVSDALSFSESLGEGRGYAFADTISFSESVTDTVTGGGAFIIPELLGDALNLKDAASTDFIYSPPGGQRGNIDYDQIRRAARSGPGSKLHTLTGSVTTGHGVVFDADGNLIDSGSAPGGGGTVTSVDLAVPTGFTVSGNPVTTSGTLTIDLSNEGANTVWAGPTTGSPAAPAFRAVVAADLPLGSSSAFGAVKVDNTSITAAAGVISAVGGAAPGMVLVEQHTASTSASLLFTTGITSTYDDYEIRIIQLVPATNNAEIYLDFSTDGGSTYDTTGGNYAWMSFGWVFAGSALGGSSSESHLILTINLAHLSSTASNGGFNGRYALFNPGGGAAKVFLTGESSHYYDGTYVDYGIIFRGTYTQTTAINAFRIIASTGNLTSGTVRLYGLKK